MLIVLLHDQKYQKSARRTRAVLLPNLVRRARVSRASHAWRVSAAKDRAKVGGFIAPRNLNYTTRANISHEKAEQIRARIVCTPAEKRWAGVNGVSTLTEVTISLLQREKVARFTAADEVLPCAYCQKNLFRYVRTQTRTKSERSCLGDADTRSAYVSIPHRRRLIKIIAHPFAQGAF